LPVTRARRPEGEVEPVETGAVKPKAGIRLPTAGWSCGRVTQGTCGTLCSVEDGVESALELGSFWIEKGHQSHHLPI
jgi:hypothetical protein